MAHTHSNHLPKSLTLKEAFLFPVRSQAGRHDVLVGTIAILLFWPIGWILNLGARLDIVKRLYDGTPPYFRGMRPYRATLRRGVVSATAIFCYLSPTITMWSILSIRYRTSGFRQLDAVLCVTGFVIFVLGVYTLPGCMTVYACEEDSAVLFQPVRAFKRATAQIHLYRKAWLISLAAIAVSFLGLLVFGIGYIAASVWAWEVVGYSFTVAMYAPVPRPD